MQPGHFEEIDHENTKGFSDEEDAEGTPKNSEDEDELAAREEREYLAAMGEIKVPQDDSLEQ
jgi:hypothetical protein